MLFGDLFVLRAPVGPVVRAGAMRTLCRSAWYSDKEDVTFISVCSLRVVGDVPLLVFWDVDRRLVYFFFFFFFKRPPPNALSTIFLRPPYLSVGGSQCTVARTVSFSSSSMQKKQAGSRSCPVFPCRVVRVLSPPHLQGGRCRSHQGA